MKVTGTQIVEALRKTDLCNNCSQESVDAYEKFLQGSFVDAVAEHMDSLVTVDSILGLKMIYISLSIREFALNSEEIPENLEEEVQKGVQEFGQMMHTLASIVEAEEQQFATLQMMHMRPELIEKTRSGTLTLGELMITQPNLVLEGPL